MAPKAPSKKAAAGQAAKKQAPVPAVIKRNHQLEALYQRNHTRGVYDDLVLLDEVDVKNVTEVLKNRYAKQEMYTAIGPVLVCVNPYKYLTKGRGKAELPIYDPQVARLYYGGETLELAPHIFRIGADAYKALRQGRQNQCVIVTGESGAGKTEAAKQIMQFVAEVTSSTGTMTGVNKHLLESNPLLEAFGNAQTARNDNSSRFGKYMELQFSYGAEVIGGKVTNYLLEKSRIVHQADGERNFHIMHYLVNGSTVPEKERHGILAPEEYQYLGNQDTRINGVSDAEKFSELKSIMSDLGMKEEQRESIFGLLSGILALGNIQFTCQGDGEQATLTKETLPALEKAAASLKVKPDELKMALTRVTLRVGRGAGATSNFRLLNKQDSERNRDTLAKEIYKRLFDWIVAQVNAAVQQDRQCLTMGILDIYGFEVFEENGFEQFCINFVNERLQQYFIEHTIKAEQEDYAREGITWNNIEYFNNEGVCDMIGGKTGMFSLLDDVGSGRSHTQAEFISNLNRRYEKLPAFLTGHAVVYDNKQTMAATNTANKRADLTRLFGIQHYAGAVAYNADQFLIKNADSLYADLNQVMASSENLVAAQVFEDLRSHAEKSRLPPSIGKQFKKQVTELTASLAACSPHYVRCIKPNDNKFANEFNIDRVTHQVTYLGLEENVKVRRQGYVYRVTFGEFLRRYSCISQVTWPDKVMEAQWPDGTPVDMKNMKAIPDHLLSEPGDEALEEGELAALKAKRAKNIKPEYLGTWKKPELDDKAAIKAILTEGKPKKWPGKASLKPLPKVELGDNSVVLAKTKIFVKEPNTLFALEESRQKALQSIVTLIQKNARGIPLRVRYLAAVKAAPKLHALARMFTQKSKFHRLIKARDLMKPATYTLVQALSNGVGANAGKPGLFGGKIPCTIISRDAGVHFKLVDSMTGEDLRPQVHVSELTEMAWVPRKKDPDAKKLKMMWGAGAKVPTTLKDIDFTESDVYDALQDLQRYHAEGAKGQAHQ